MEYVTTTGWRLKGSQTIELLAQAAERLDVPDRSDDAVYAARFRMRPRLGGGSAVGEALAALTEALRSDWPGAPALTREQPLRRTADRSSGLQWSVNGRDGAWIGELVWRHPHPVVRGAVCTTHMILREQADLSDLAVRVLVDGGRSAVRGAVGAGQSRPRFLTAMHRALRMEFAGTFAEPRLITGDEVDQFVSHTLLSETRTLPAAVLSPQEGGGYLVPPETLGEELLGLASLHVLADHQDTFRLTDALGDRRLSAYWGALRVYLPDFSCADAPAAHPLLVRDQIVDPVLRAELVGRLALRTAISLRMPPGIASAVETVDVAAPKPSADRNGYHPADGNGHHAEDTTAPVRAPEVAPEQITAMIALMNRLLDGQAQLTEEVARLRTSTAVRAANTAFLERRVASFEHLLDGLVATLRGDSVETATGEATITDDHADTGEEAEEEAGDRTTLVDVVRHAATAHADALLVLDSAERSAYDSPYEDPDRVATILHAMAHVAQRRQSGGLGTSLREAFRELGVEYRGGIAPGTSHKLRRQHLAIGPDGTVYDCDEHIVLGGTYDPRRCLRIYFTSRAPHEPRFVIGHVGRHLDVKTTT